MRSSSTHSSLRMGQKRKRNLMKILDQKGL